MKETASLLLLHYLRIIAKIQISKIRLIQFLKGKPLITIGITGSAGKTSAMLAVQSALIPDFIVKTNYGGNSETGIPLSILGLELKDFSLPDWLRITLLAPLQLLTNWRSYEIFLIEMGIDAGYEPKNMSYLLKIITPSIGVFLNVTPVHLMNFDTLEDIARQKALLPNSARTALINPADPLVKKFTHNPNTIEILPQKLIIKNHPLPSIYDISFGTALSIGLLLGLKKEKIIKNIKNNFHLPPGRCTLLQGIKNSTIIDSSYNSSPLATGELLGFLKTFPQPRLAILGDMRELGKATSPAHQKLYLQALESADTIISVGPETQKYFGSKALKFSFWWQAAEYIKNNLPEKSTILIKGSQNTIFLEEIIKEITSPDQLQNYLSQGLICRQSPYWLKLKKRFYALNS